MRKKCNRCRKEYDSAHRYDSCPHRLIDDERSSSMNSETSYVSPIQLYESDSSSSSSGSSSDDSSFSGGGGSFDGGGSSGDY